MGFQEEYSPKRTQEIILLVKEKYQAENLPDLPEHVMIALFESEELGINHSNTQTIEKLDFDLSQKGRIHCLEHKGRRLLILDPGTNRPDQVIVDEIADRFQSCEEFLKEFHSRYEKTRSGKPKSNTDLDAG